MATWRVNGELITNYFFDVEAEDEAEACEKGAELIHGNLVDNYTVDLWMEAHEVEG